MKIEQAKKVLEAAHGKKGLSEEAFKAVVSATKVFISHYRTRPQAFIEDYIRILHGQTNEECEFILNEAQSALVGALSDNRFVAAPKARQLGITTLTNALALHHSLFAKNANVICMAYKTDNANENLRRIKTMFKTMPEWVQNLVMEWDENKKHVDNVGMWAFRSKMTNTENKLEVSSASSEDATRGKTPTFLHWTETAFSEVADQIFTSVFPALNRRKDSVIVLESTGNGNSGFYYEVCVGIRKGFEVVFMPWFLDSNYRLTGDQLTEEDREYIKDLMGVEEFPEGLDEDQLRWYRATSGAIGKAKGQQEYPVSVEQVFQATNSSFFNYKTVNKVGKGEPLHTLAIENGYLMQRPAASGQVFAPVKTEFEYLIAVDPSEGVTDPSVITVLDPDGVEVLFWRERMIPDDLIKLIDVLGKHFNNAKVIVENNGIGMYVVNSLMTHYLYPNLWFEDGKPGFRTSHGNKAYILATLQDFILNGKITINNVFLGPEMSKFEADTLRAQKGEHDDCVLSASIAAYAFRKDPPKRRYVQDAFNDYTNEVYGSQGRKRRNFISRRQ